MQKPSSFYFCKPVLSAFRFCCRLHRAGIFFLLFFAAATTCAAQSYWQQQVDYLIDVKLNDEEHTLDGFEKILYTNHSPDTLTYIWFHLWPNAYKNDKTAFSEQLLLGDKTNFYFSSPEQRGYINRLHFEVNGSIARMEDHPQYIDVVKLWLPQPLLSGQSITITTPFHVKLPANFSRGGHTGQSYQITQWYPKPAVYDSRGWHDMPYLDQGEFYSEFGDYQVNITVPAAYVVAATGELQNRDELEWIKRRTAQPVAAPIRTPKTSGPKKKTGLPSSIKKIQVTPTDTSTKTLVYKQARVHDFAWFADKRYLVSYDTLRLASGNTKEVFSYYLPEDAAYWKNSLRSIKEAVLTRSAWLGEYPYKTVSVVEAQMGVTGGMEYPTITSISPLHDEQALYATIAHEVSHNWLYGILASNERRNPWMDEGMNTYYDMRFLQAENRARNNIKTEADHLATKIGLLYLKNATSIRKDQPINTSADAFSTQNYPLVAYLKSGMWMKKLENRLGQPLFDSCMRTYFGNWQFKHPYPEDFKAALESVRPVNLNDLFRELDQKGDLDTVPRKLVVRAPSLNLLTDGQYNPVFVAPLVGFNLYDGFMIGGGITNIRPPFERLEFLVAPLFATGSKRLGGTARAAYNWYPDRSAVYKLSAGIAASLFSINKFQPENGSALFLGVRKLAPFVRATLREDPLSKRERYVQFKSFLIGEDQLDFRQVVSPTDTQNVVSKVARNYVVNQLKFVVKNTRILYPYSGELQVEQGRGFVRAAFTGNYFFNYSKGEGGLDLRFFAGKFFYTGGQTTLKQFETDRFHLNLTGANGQEDYTYSNYFVARNKFEGFASQQIMMRDGGFKVRTDLLSSKVGKTDNWLSALNGSARVPKSINPLQLLPFSIPLKVFADVGTYAEAWDRDANLNRFLFDAGLQFSLFNETVNIYVPLVYSPVYRDYFKSTLGKNRFWKTISFSLDIQRFSWRKIDSALPL
ncbi:MAG: M1 family metallopeptidase [Williamsia sp.]|nr:M1 family metallopeptidase [Williamsia sp.]